MNPLDRRSFIQYLTAGASLAFANPSFAEGQKDAKILQKIIPSSQQPMTVIGMGTWQTFNVGSDEQLRDDRTKILELFFRLGGQMVDSSPMYGSSQQVVGHGLTRLDYPKNLFSAEKVWTRDESATRKQIKKTSDAWRVQQFDLMQVHNLVSWREHLEVLKEMREKGEVRYIGITTSHGRRHSDLAKIMESQPIDFVQLTYNMEDREVEQNLLPLAQEKGIAIIANRPFQGGRLVNRLQRAKTPLPEFASEIQCQNWPQFLLKFVVSHPAVTCAIPATTQLAHMQENMGAATGSLPDAQMRQEMLAYVNSI